MWRLLGPDADHHDVVQQVFLKIVRHGTTLRDPDKLSAWVQTVAANVVYQELRKREARRQLLRELSRDEVQGTLVRDVEVRDYLRRAKDVLDLLPAKERAVFCMAVIEGYPLETVASHLGYSPSTAKRRLASAKKRFAVLLARHPELFSALHQPGTRSIAARITSRQNRC